jgi:hypothetical protein
MHADRHQVRQRTVHAMRVQVGAGRVQNRREGDVEAHQGQHREVKHRLGWQSLHHAAVHLRAHVVQPELKVILLPRGRGIKTMERCSGLGRATERGAVVGFRATHAAGPESQSGCVLMRTCPVVGGGGSRTLGQRQQGLQRTMKKASDAGSTPNEASHGSVSAPAVVTTIASFRFCRIVRLKDAQKKISAKGSSLCHREVAPSGSSTSLRCSTGTYTFKSVFLQTISKRKVVFTWSPRGHAIPANRCETWASARGSSLEPQPDFPPSTRRSREKELCIRRRPHFSASEEWQEIILEVAANNDTPIPPLLESLTLGK